MDGIAAFISYFFTSAFFMECTLLVGFVFVLNMKRTLNTALERFHSKPEKESEKE